MKLREIIKLSAIMLSLDDVLECEELYDESYDILKENEIIASGNSVEKNLNLMIRCFNLVYNEIATDYLPLVTIENINITTGNFDLKNLENHFYKLIKLEDKHGNNVKFDIYDNILYVKNGEYKVVYCYIPEKVTLNSEVNNFNGKIVDRVFAYGLNKEYCFISGLYSEAESYKTKFEESLKSASSLKKDIKLPHRRWR